MSQKIKIFLLDILGAERNRFQLLRHLAVGGIGVLFNWIAFSSLRYYSSLSTLACTILVHVFLLAIIFPLQKVFTFKKKDNGQKQAIKFLANDAGYITIDYFFAWLFIDFLGLTPILGKGLGLALLTPISFLSQRYWVFK